MSRIQKKVVYYGILKLFIKAELKIRGGDRKTIDSSMGFLAGIEWRYGLQIDLDNELVYTTNAERSSKNGRALLN